MLTEFFYKYRITRVACWLSLFFVLACVGYAFSLSKAKEVNFEESVYFLVLEDARIEAGTEFVKWQGGAGYLLSLGEEEYVAISVFLNKESAEIVQKRLRENGQKTSLIKKGVQRLYFKGKEKRKASMYINALNLFKSYVHLLEDCIGRLENGLTQEGCKRILKTLEKQFCYAQKVYAGYPAFSHLCDKSSQELSKICEGIIYLKDLRYLLCYQIDVFFALCDVFFI